MVKVVQNRRENQLVYHNDTYAIDDFFFPFFFYWITLFEMRQKLIGCNALALLITW